MQVNWIDAREQPEEETTVLVYLESGFVTLGIFLKGKWEAIIAPWDFTPWEDAAVLCWTPLPWPSLDNITKFETTQAQA